MNGDKGGALDASELRRNAEEQFNEQTKGGGVRVPGQEMQRLFHELEVHQIELEMQNEELRRSRAEVEAGLEKYSDLYDFAPVGYVTLDGGGIILSANLSAATQLGVQRSRLCGKPLAAHVQPDYRQIFHAHLERVFESGEREVCEIGITGKNGEAAQVQLQSIADQTSEEDVRICRMALMDITSRAQAERELAELRDALAVRVKELEEAAAQIQVLHAILPTCMYCHKIRDDQDSWHKIEEYIQQHSDTQFSHGICPACMEEHYPGVGLTADCKNSHDGSDTTRPRSSRPPDTGTP
jgi:PAS domain S-box-containing protein